MPTDRDPLTRTLAWLAATAALMALLLGATAAGTHLGAQAERAALATQADSLGRVLARLAPQIDTMTRACWRTRRLEARFPSSVTGGPTTP